VPLNEILSPVVRPETPLPGKIYRQIGVRWWGEGAYEREPVDGAATQYKSLFSVKTGDVIIDKIWARHGSVAVVQDSLDGCYGSNEFPMFVLERKRLEPRWFHWLTKTKGFWAKCDEKSRGTSGKNRIRPERFLEIEIPLPSLDEQRRIVARLDETSSKVEEVRSLRKEAIDKTEVLILSVLEALFPEDGSGRFKYRPIRDAIVEHKQGYYPGHRLLEGSVCFARISDITDDAYLDYNNMPRVAIDGRTLDAFRVNPGDFLFARTGGAGRFALARGQVGCVFASYLIRFRFKKEYDPEFLRHYFLSPRFQSEISSRIHGGVNQNIDAEDIKNVSVPVLSDIEQRRVIVYLDKLQGKWDTVKNLQHETEQQFKALLPAILSQKLHGIS
jgi:type I restriction enzyme S subunit